MKPNAPPEEAVRRFTADLALCGVSPSHRLALCVSGGPDSLAMLLLAKAADISCAAATVDHRLRPEAKEEAIFVSSLCRILDIDHEILTVKDTPSGNVSDWARTVRYGELRLWAGRRSFDVLLTAHHADDQLETMLMRLNRGSGIAGLSGIRNRNSDIARPLLSWRKSELEALVRECGVAMIEDPTNRDDRYDRARIRKQLANVDWLNPVAAVQSAAALAQANDALEWTAETLFAAHAMIEDRHVTLVVPETIPKELVRRLVLRAIDRINPIAKPRGVALTRLIESLRAGRTMTLGGVKCRGGHHWRFSREAPRRTK